LKRFWARLQYPYFVGLEFVVSEEFAAVTQICIMLSDFRGMIPFYTASHTNRCRKYFHRALDPPTANCECFETSCSFDGPLMFIFANQEDFCFSARENVPKMSSHMVVCPNVWAPFSYEEWTAVDHTGPSLCHDDSSDESNDNTIDGRMDTNIHLVKLWSFAFPFLIGLLGMIVD
jgi:hypothetical protein